jgi:hypothetical protein
MLSLKKERFYFIIFSLVSGISYFLIAYSLKRENTIYLFSVFTLLASSYYLILLRVDLLTENYNDFVIVAFIFRLLFVLSVPTLSDDFYRFIWDGRLIQEGLNPFGYLPSQIVKEHLLAGSNNIELYQKMNSPNYYSVYPPILQLVFFISAKLSFGYNMITIFNLRFFILLAEFGTFIFLKKILDFLKFNKIKIFFYLLNPLVIIELVGNIHFEAIMIFFLTASLYYLVISKNSFSAIFIAFAIATKMIPLIFLPLIVRKIGWKKGLIYATFSLTIVVISFLPFIDKHLISNVGDSIGLYFQKFEFNASIYYLSRELGFRIVGYNAISIIGKVLPVISTCLILFLSFVVKGNDSWQGFFKRGLIIIFIYYLFSLVVHPWYVSLLVLLSVFVESRFAILWSILIFATYFAYNTIPYKESLWVIAIEYALVILFFLCENKKLKAVYVFN